MSNGPNRGLLLLVLVLSVLGTLVIGVGVPLLLAARTEQFRVPTSPASTGGADAPAESARDPQPSAAVIPTATPPPRSTVVSTTLAAEPEPGSSEVAPTITAASRGQTSGVGSRDELDPTLPTPKPSSIVLDEDFSRNMRGWPGPTETAWFGSGGYYLQPRYPGRAVAVRVPIVVVTPGVHVTGIFQKTGGPSGGGYGLILRDNSATSLDGRTDQGQYYVFEVGDLGEFGVWRRNNDVWTDLISWTRSPSVHPGTTSNVVGVEANGATFTFVANGMLLANVGDAALSDGYVGVFVGGDLNQVRLERLTVENLE